MGGGLVVRVWEREGVADPGVVSAAVAVIVIVIEAIPAAAAVVVVVTHAGARTHWIRRHAGGLEGGGGGVLGRILAHNTKQFQTDFVRLWADQRKGKNGRPIAGVRLTILHSALILMRI